METSWLGGRVPLPDLEEMIDGALRPVPKPMGPERPLRLSAARRLPGADGRLPAALEGELRLNARVARVVARAAHASRSHDGTRYRYEQLISTDAAAGAHSADRRRGAGRRARGRARAAARVGALRQSRRRRARTSPTSTGSTIPRTRSSTASSCRATPARTAIRPAASASPARSPTRRTSRCRATARR